MKITVLIFISLLGMTVEECCHRSPLTEDQQRKLPFSSESKVGKDTTKDQIKNIFDIFQLFHTRTIEKSNTDWISQHQSFEMPSDIINSTNITFTKFIPDTEILPLSNLDKITCDFKRNLKIQFRPGYKIRIDGYAKLHHFKNNSSCHIPFNFNIVRTTQTIVRTQNSDEFSNRSVEIVFQDFSPDEIENFAIINSKDESCQRDTNQNKIAEFTRQAVNNLMQKRFKIVARLIFESMLNECIHPQLNESNENYIHFKLKPNMKEFPWNADYNELNVTGLNNFARIQATYYSNVHLIDYYIYLYNVHIRLDVMSVTKKRYHLDASYVRITSRAKTNTSIDYFEVDLQSIAETNNLDHIELLKHSSPDVGFGQTEMLGMKNNALKQITMYIPEMSEPCNDGEIDVDVNMKNKVTTLILAGIEQTFHKIRYDGTRKFTNTIRKILAPFNEKIFENVVNDLEYKTSGNSSIWFSNIEMKANSHFENITCTVDNDEQKIGTITYENITGQANFITDAITFDGLKRDVLESTIIHIRQINFNISLQKYPNQTNEVAIQINDDFEMADKMILFDEPRKNRITLGQSIHENFIKLLRNQINITMNSAFLPLFDTCTGKDISSNNAETANSRQYFAFIRSHRINFINPAAVIINGTWNFKHINAQYVNGNLIVDGLRLENITGQVKLWDQSKKPIIRKFAGDFLVTIDHANTNVKVNLAENAFDFDPDMMVDEEKHTFETTVAFFIEQSIYGHLTTYTTKYRKLAKETMMKDVEENTRRIDERTSVFANNLAKTLKRIPNDDQYHLPDRYRLELKKNDPYFARSTLPYQITADIAFSRSFAEEICDNFNYSADVSSFGENFNLNGQIEIKNINPGSKLSGVHYTATRYRVINISNNKNEYNAELKIYIDNMAINGNFKEFDKNILRSQYTKLANVFMEYRLKSFSYPPNICRNRYGSLKSAPSKNHFYLIANTINDASQNFLTYYIKLYGFYNLKRLHFQILEDKYRDKTFEITATNLTAQVTWSYYVENSFLRKPNKMELKIDQILLKGEIWNLAKKLIFTKIELQISGEQNKKSTKFEETLKMVITDSIKNSVKEKYMED